MNIIIVLSVVGAIWAAKEEMPGLFAFCFLLGVFSAFYAYVLN
jgi:uncharacterized membrane protein